MVVANEPLVSSQNFTQPEPDIKLTDGTERLVEHFSSFTFIMLPMVVVSLLQNTFFNTA